MDRSDIFISYRRKNIIFAEKLDIAFKNEGYEVWIDSEDIAPASPEYMTDIEKGIEGADIVVPIFSPDYFESDICKKELQYAVDNNKRIIPIIYEKGFDSSSMPASVRDINWVYFCPHMDKENDFDSAFPKLLQGIRLNHDYARLHTQYLIRAKNWDENERNESYLLIGEEIGKAQVWLATQIQIAPYPSNLQTQYIVTSRQVEDKRLEKERELERKAAHRQRNFILLLFGGLIIAFFWMNSNLGQARGVSQKALEEYLGTSLRASVLYIIDRETMSDLIVTKEEDGQYNAINLEYHLSDLSFISEIYPSINSYSINSEGEIIGQYQDISQVIASIENLNLGNAPEPVFWHQQGTSSERWIVAWLDIADEEGNYLATLVMEYRDPRSEIEFNLSVGLGFIAIITMITMGFYLLLFVWHKIVLVIWHKIRSWFSKPKLEANPEKLMSES